MHTAQPFTNRVGDDRCRKRKGKWTDIYAHNLVHIVVWGCIQSVDWTGWWLLVRKGNGRHYRRYNQNVTHE